LPTEGILKKLKLAFSSLTTSCR